MVKFVAQLKKCPKCGAKFRKKKNFKKHYQAAHEGGAKWTKDW